MLDIYMHIFLAKKKKKNDKIKETTQEILINLK